MSENPLINIGELSKPATVLIEKISDAVGGIFKPSQIVRVAKAEAEAKRIEAETQIEITNLERRAFARFIKEEARKQNNIEQITQKALPLLEEDAQPDNVEEDWIANFFDKSRLISDYEMQNLWARVLAGEANSPGSYSKRTISLLASLDKSDAVLFTSLCSFGWFIHESEIIPLVLDNQNKVYNDHGINFVTLNHLQSIGLITFSSTSSIAETDLPKEFMATYYDRTIKLEMPSNSENLLSVGEVLLTKAGFEIAPICGSRPVEGFFDFVSETWKSYIKKEELSQDIQPPIEAE
jgi:uncharacterized protein DUF2806